MQATTADSLKLQSAYSSAQNRELLQKGMARLLNHPRFFLWCPRAPGEVGEREIHEQLQSFMPWSRVLCN